MRRRGYDARVDTVGTFHALPRLDECPNRFVGRVPWRRRAGDNDAFLLEPIDAEKGTAEDEFPFHRAKRIEARHKV